MKQPSTEVLERIADAAWNKSGKGVYFNDIYQHNACNHTYSGTIEVDNTIYGFIVEMGDWNGCVVLEWGDPENVGTYEPPPKENITFIPANNTLSVTDPELFKIYARWRKEKWFQEIENNYNYDRHFQPGGKIEEYYRNWASKKGLKPGYLSQFTKTELEVINAK